MDEDFDADAFFLNDALMAEDGLSVSHSGGTADDDLDPLTAAMLHAADDLEQAQAAVLQNLETGERIDVADLPFTIGSASSCDLTVSSPGVAGEHARIENQFQRYVIQDLTRHYAQDDSDDTPFAGGVKVNGYRVENVPLEEGDEIAIGDDTFLDELIEVVDFVLHLGEPHRRVDVA